MDEDKSTEMKIWKAVYGVLQGRRGFDNWWGNIDSDIQSEIILEATSAVKQTLFEDREEKLFRE